MPDEILFQATIKGNLQSKANSRQLVKFGNRPMIIKSKVAREYCKAFLLQITQFKRPPQCPYTHDVALYATIYYQSRRNDLDESLLMDLLQCGTPKNPGAGILANDRQIKFKVIQWALDQENPRVEFLLTPYNVPGLPWPLEKLRQLVLSLVRPIARGLIQ